MRGWAALHATRPRRVTPLELGHKGHNAEPESRRRDARQQRVFRGLLPDHELRGSCLGHPGGLTAPRACAMQETGNKDPYMRTPFPLLALFALVAAAQARAADAPIPLPTDYRHGRTSNRC